MFKKLQYFFLILTLISTSQPNVIQSQTFCLVDCHDCYQGPYKCSFIQSLLFLKSNRNCLPYSVGKSCEEQPEGFQMIGKGLEGWVGLNHTVKAPIECQINNEDANTPLFKSIGPFKQKPISKTFTMERNTLEAIIVKMSFTINSQNLTISEYDSSINKKQTVSPPSASSQPPVINPDGTIDTITEDTTVQQSSKSKQSNINKKIIFHLLVKGPDISYKIQLNTPSKYFPNQRIISSSCGTHVQYVSAHKLPKQVRLLNKTQLKFEIIPQQNLMGQWNLVKFQVSVGCGGLIVNAGNTTCSACATGYYPVMGHQNILMNCAPCDPTCKACTKTRCTLCQQISQFKQSTGQCGLKSTYKIVTNIKYEKGKKLEKNPKNQYFLNTYTSEDSSIILRSELFSPSPYWFKFLFIYSRQFIVSLKKRSVNIMMSNQILLKIQAEQFKEEVGMYDERFQMGKNVKYYVKTIYINRLQQQNENKILSISIKAPADSSVFYVSNFYLLQYQCVDKCAQCNRVEDKCLRCSSFFVLKGNIACSTCPNGFYLYKIPQNTSIEQFQRQEQICIKCHSTCKQCIGPGLHQCSSCYKLFNLDLKSLQLNTTCIRCVYQAKMQMQMSLEQCQPCLSTFSYQSVFSTQNCTQCIKNRNIDDLQTGQVCSKCWVQNGLAYGRCKETDLSSLSFYGSDLNQEVIKSNNDSIWQVDSSTISLKRLNCSNDYTNLWGIERDEDEPNHSKNISIKWTEKNLPVHSGFYIIFNIFKKDLRLIDIEGEKRAQKIYININEKIFHVIDFSIKRSGSTIIPGWNLCGGNQNQMISTFSFDSPEHTGDSLSVNITSEGGNIFLRQLQLYLGKCPQCSDSLKYQIKHMPTYHFNLTYSILNIWILFNKPIMNTNNIHKAFIFKIDKIGSVDLNSVNFTNQLQVNNRLKYIIPILKSFQGGKIHVQSNPEVKIYANLSSNATKRLLINSQLNTQQSQELIQRISHLNPDQNISSSQVYSFYNFFQWFSLIVMIIMAGLGLGVVFQEFSILLQLLFLHTYITSHFLPGTFKSAILGLSRMENLNYFSDQHGSQLQNQWFKDYLHPTPIVFQQYNTDIFFLRSFYPIIIINIIYVIVFFILLLALKFSQTLKLSNNPIISIFRQIPARPINYFDQIWRYQFVTTVWSAVMQFHRIKKDTPLQNINLAICIISFIISLIWPIAIVIYTYYRNKYKRATDFVYIYEDIFFLKFETVSQMKPKYYYYIFIRFARYLIIAIFINIFIEQEIIPAIILIAVNLVEIVYVYALDIYYENKLGCVFKILENLLFIGAEVMYLAAYAMVDVSTETDFHNLGSAMNVLYVFMIILGMLRVLYLGFKKFEAIKMNARVNIDTGQQFKDHQVRVPDTERNEEANNIQI